MNELTKHRQTALHLAAQQDLPTICSVLLENAVDFAALDENGNNGSRQYAPVPRAECPQQCPQSPPPPAPGGWFSQQQSCGREGSGLGVCPPVDHPWAASRLHGNPRALEWFPVKP